MLLPIDRNPSTARIRRFGWTMCLALAVIGTVCWYRGAGGRFGQLPVAWHFNLGMWHVLAGIVWAAAVFFITVSRFAFGRQVYVGWMTLGQKMGTVTSAILLTVAYLILLPPFAFIRVFDPLKMRLTRQESYWQNSPPGDHSLERTARPF